MTPGYVYLLRMLDSQHLYSSLEFDINGCSYKIGKSKTPVTRYNTIAVKAPYPVELLGAMPVEDMSATETYLHQKLDRYRRRGEWFALPSVAVDWVCNFISITTSGYREIAKWRGISDRASIEWADEAWRQFIEMHVVNDLFDDSDQHFQGKYPTL